MARHSGVDPYLSHLPDRQTATRGGTTAHEKPTRTTRSFSQPTKVVDRSDWFPALVRLPYSSFTIPTSITQFQENSRIGNVLSGRGSKAALEALGELPGVSIEVSRDGGSWELDKSLPTVKGHDVGAPDGATPETQCLVAVIDACIDPTHEAFCDQDGKTRLLYVWDQTATAGPPPRSAGFPFDYGTFYTKADITRTLEQATPFSIAPQASEDERLHGTHVASIAAGRRTLDSEGKPCFAGGMAPDAPLVVVIPALSAGEDKRPSQGFAKSHIDALRFIEAVAQREGLPVVVNVSAGIAAGAHDGTSTLEAGFDAFTNGGHAAGRAVVKSAGNSQDAERYRRFDISNGGDVKVDLNAPTSGSQAATLEAWFSSAHELELTLKEQDRAPTFTLSERTQGTLELHLGTAILSYQRFHHDNGDSQLLVSLPPSKLGFELTFSGRAVRGLGTIDVWIEGDLTLTKPSSERTLTVPGSARTVITVASSDRDGRLMSDTSSHGPTRDSRSKPELFAPGMKIRAAKAGTRFDTIAASGTSMAAPHVTGAIALCFSKQARLKRELPNALQIRAALIATATGMDGNWRADRGFGLLNTEAFLKAFDEPEATRGAAEEPTT